MKFEFVLIIFVVDHCVDKFKPHGWLASNSSNMKYD